MGMKKISVELPDKVVKALQSQLTELTDRNQELEEECARLKGIEDRLCPQISELKAENEELSHWKKCAIKALKERDKDGSVFTAFEQSVKAQDLQSKLTAQSELLEEANKLIYETRYYDECGEDRDEHLDWLTRFSEFKKKQWLPFGADLEIRNIGFQILAE